MRIAVDGFNLAMPRGTGVATYARNLTQALTAMGHQVDVIYGMPLGGPQAALLREVQFFDALDREAGRPAPKLGTPRWLGEVALLGRTQAAAAVPVTGMVEARAFASRMPSFERILNVTDLFGRAERHFKRWGRFMTIRAPDPVPDIMHWTYPLPILLEGARNIYTMHDLVPLRLPYTTLDNKRIYLRLLRGCLTWGDHICTVSESSRRDIMTVLGAPADKVTNTYQAVRDAAAPVETDGPEGLAAWLEGLFGLKPDGYFLFFGALEPKKNVGRLIEAHLSSGLSIPLVIIGGRAWKSESELRLIQRQPGGDTYRHPGGRVVQLEYAPSPWLAGLVRGARAVVFPSIYEGFGLPVLEAMQAGRPVLTSTAGSLPEVAGTAAMLVDPYDTVAIGDGLRQLAHDDALCARMAADGPVQAAKFGMGPYRERLAALYRAVPASSGGARDAIEVGAPPPQQERHA